MKLAFLAVAGILFLGGSPALAEDPEHDCYETKAKHVVCWTVITGNQYAVAVTTADGQQSDVGVLIPNILLIDCDTGRWRGRGTLPKASAGMMAKAFCKDLDKGQYQDL